jgi:hypothetical protein
VFVGSNFFRDSGDPRSPVKGADLDSLQA